MPCMQDRKTGKMRPALGPTAEEFVDEVLAPTMVAMDKLLKGKAGKRSHISKRESIIYSFDGAGIHEASLNKKKGNGVSLAGAYQFDEETQRAPLPPYSGDMHRVIEHSHGIAAIAFKKWLYRQPAARTTEDYKQAFERVYRECITAAVVAADVETLPELYQWIWEHDGAVPPSRLR